MDPTVAAKQALRGQIHARRRQQAGSSERERAAALLAQAVLDLVDERFGRSGCRVAAYLSTRLEPPTDVLVRQLRCAGHEVILPVVGTERSLGWDLGGERLPASALGTAHLVLTPGLAVDRSGARLGQGGGFYDTALAFVGPDAPVLTVLWDGELVDEPLPVQQHDRRVDGVLTPGHGVVWFALP